MMRSLPVMMVWCALVLLAPAQDARPVQGRLVVEEGQRTLYLWGGAKDRGYAHGYLLARDILDAIDKDFGSFVERIPGGTRAYERVLLKRVIPNFQFTPDEVAEMEGMLAGIEAALPPDDRIVALLERPLLLGDLKAINTVGDWMALGCSSVAVPGSMTADGAPAAVRNFDFPGLNALLDRQHLVVVRPADPEKRGYVGVSHPGCIGVMTAMNRDGVFTSVHDVQVKPNFNDAFKNNVPRLCVLRRFMMGLPTGEAVPTALEWVRGWPTLYGNNLLVVTPHPAEGQPFAGVLEYDKRKSLDEGAVLRVIDGHSEAVCHHLICTNHHRVRTPDEDFMSCWRYRALHEAVSAEGDHPKIGFEDLVQIVDAAALPKERVQQAYRHGTLHQAIGLTGSKTFCTRFGQVGKNIRECSWRKVSVTAALERAAAPAAAGR